MQFYRSFARTLALSGAVLALTLGGAQAWQADEVAARLKSTLDGQGFEADWTAVEKDGSSIILSDVTLGGSDDEKAKIGDVTLEDVTEDEDSFTIGHVALPDYIAANEDGKIAVNGFSLTGLDLPKTDESTALPRYRSAALGSAVVTDKDGKTLYTLTNMQTEIQSPPEDGTLAFTGTVERFTMDLAATAEEDAQRARLDELGYSQISGSAAMAGSWRPSDGHLKLSQYSVAVDNAGTFGVTADFAGFTPETVKALRDMGGPMIAGGGENMAASGMAMMGLAQQLTFGGLSLSFEDAGLTDKALKMAAKKQGVEPAQYANQIKADIPQTLTDYLGPDMAGQIAQAVGAFLDDPQNIEIRLQPATPLPFVILAGAAMGAPQSLVQMLGLKVTANR